MNPKERQDLMIARTKKFEPAVHTADVKCGESRNFSFIYNGDPEDIEGYKIHCKTCTKVVKAGNVLVATFTAPSCSDYYDNKQRGESEQAYTSHISVYFRDGEPFQRYNADGELKDNPDKVAVSLQIRTRILF